MKSMKEYIKNGKVSLSDVVIVILCVLCVYNALVFFSMRTSKQDAGEEVVTEETTMTQPEELPPFSIDYANYIQFEDHGAHIVTDNETGVQYILIETSWGMTAVPRYNADGSHHQIDADSQP